MRIYLLGNVINKLSNILIIHISVRRIITKSKLFEYRLEYFKEFNLK